MHETFDTHLFTGNGALCGAAMPFAWEWRESRVTCTACRAMLARGNTSRRHEYPRSNVAPVRNLSPE
jgi:hypothetical protein